MDFTIQDEELEASLNKDSYQNQQELARLSSIFGGISSM